MSCDAINVELVDFHFGELELERRDAVEAHLADCSSCLREFLAVKRAIEIPDLDARPSRKARRRLREAVAAELADKAPRWSWWERPAAFVFAGATVLAAILFVQMVSSGTGSMPSSLRDPVEATAPGDLEP